MLRISICAMLTVAALYADAEQDPMQIYQRGVEAQTIGEREDAFEDALAAYLGEYNRQQESGLQNGYLCYNIANCYYNLGQIGEAVLFYKKALKLLPGDAQILQNLQTALADRQDAYDVESGGLHEQLLFFHYGWSLQRRSTVVVWTGVLAALLLIGLMLAPDRKALRSVVVIALVIFAVFAISLAASSYSPRRIAVFVQPGDVRQGAGEGFAPILSSKLGSGSSVEVTGIADNWFEVRLNDGRRGYVSSEHLRLVL